MQDSVTSKDCPDCQDARPVDEFYRYSNGSLYRYCKTHHNKRVCQYVKDNPSKKRNANLRQNYKITAGEYEILFAQQGGVCAACGNPQTGSHYGKPSQLAVDHNHKTGAIRGLLCRQCNTALGSLQDNPERIKSLLRYLLEGR